MYGLLPVLLAGAFTSSLPFRVSYLNTPFQLIRCHIRISTPHCKQFIHSFRYTPQPSISFQERSVRCISFLSLPTILPTLSSGIYLPPATCSPHQELYNNDLISKKKQLEKTFNTQKSSDHHTVSICQSSNQCTGLMPVFLWEYFRPSRRYSHFYFAEYNHPGIL